jgi:hypothetical protein
MLKISKIFSEIFKLGKEKYEQMHEHACGCECGEESEIWNIRARTFNIVDVTKQPIGEKKVDKTALIGKVICVTNPLSLKEGKFECQFSFCSPMDLNRFNRDHGKFIATMRMWNPKSKLTFVRTPGRKIVEDVKLLMVQEAHRKAKRDNTWLKKITLESIR